MNGGRPRPTARFEEYAQKPQVSPRLLTYPPWHAKLAKSEEYPKATCTNSVILDTRMNVSKIENEKPGVSLSRDEKPQLLL